MAKKERQEGYIGVGPGRTLIVCGRYDEVTPDCAETLHAGIRGSELVIFEESSHLAHFEEPDRFFDLLRGFLRRAHADSTSPDG